MKALLVAAVLLVVSSSGAFCCDPFTLVSANYPALGIVYSVSQCNGQTQQGPAFVGLELYYVGDQLNAAFSGTGLVTNCFWLYETDESGSNFGYTTFPPQQAINGAVGEGWIYTAACRDVDYTFFGVQAGPCEHTADGGVYCGAAVLWP